MNQYPTWKNVLVLAVLLLGTLLALPNIFGDDFAILISHRDGSTMVEREASNVRGVLDGEGIAFRSATLEDGRVLVRFAQVETQLNARDVIEAAFEQRGDANVVALALEPRTPPLLQRIGLKPISMGLDLRGGVHFLYEVDMAAAIDQRLKSYANDFRALLRENDIPRGVSLRDREIRVQLNSPEDLDRSRRLIRDADPDLAIEEAGGADKPTLSISMTDAQIKARQDFAIQQNITTLRNRTNELGVAEPIVQRHGQNRIVVQLPGVQDPGRAKVILQATATLEFRLVDEDNDAFDAQQSGRAPIGSELFNYRDRGPVLLKRATIVTGDQLTDANSGFDQDGLPAVFVKLDAKGARRMLDTTRNNLNRGMAVLYVDTTRTTVERNGERVDVPKVERRVISVATIRGVFGNSFQITGLDPVEARDLALLLRAGSLAAPIYEIEERTIGPSLGKDNIDKGFRAVQIGFLLVVAFMIVYYRVFGLVANLALFTNLVLIVALLSLLQASLTLPGIAGIVLTVGMAVDANVLIFERIREEIRNGNSPQASIHAGYEKAFSSIADANITTLIAAVVLFTFGTGPIKGFAITLSLGIMTSMFTAIVGTRALINLIYGRRRLDRLPI